MGWTRHCGQNLVPSDYRLEVLKLAKACQQLFWFFGIFS